MERIAGEPPQILLADLAVAEGVTAIHAIRARLPELRPSCLPWSG